MIYEFREHRQNIFEFLIAIMPLKFKGGKDVTNKIWKILGENLFCVKYGLYMKKLPTYQTEQHNTFKKHLKCLQRGTCL